MFKTLIYIGLMLLAISSYTQEDSTWRSSVTLYHTKDADIANQNPINYTIGLLQIAKNNHTIIGYLGHKSNYAITGLQYGIDYYKKREHGYYHVGVKKSNALFYPTLSLEVNYYKNVYKGIELGIGHRYLTYANGNHSHVSRGSVVLYSGQWMLSYRITHLDLSRLYHFGSARLWLSDNDLYLEANVANAGETIGSVTLEELLISSISYGLKVGLRVNESYDLFAAYNRTSTTQLKINRSINGYAVGVKIKI